ncbi:hypothetical protein [Fangia hongkongensis]|nr:hypothetical protein [Fangia hongkongensis]MBK2125950.1 hypothetical protein [Fangia hongkongensis]
MHIIKKSLMLAAVITSGAYGMNCDNTNVQTVFNLISSRANLMQSVAADKYTQNKAPYAAAQELKVLNNIEKIAASQKLPLYPLLTFAQIQMDFSKQIEQYWLDKWHENPQSFNQKAVPLDQIRQEIHSIDSKLYPAIKAAIPELKSCPITELSGLFSHSLKAIQGIPKKPDYNQIMIHALVVVAQNAE